MRRRGELLLYGAERAAGTLIEVGQEGLGAELRPERGERLVRAAQAVQVVAGALPEGPVEIVDGLQP
jgi:hypothetical protein